MDFKEIQELIRMVNKHNIAELTIENQDFRIKIRTTVSAPASLPAPVMVQQVPQVIAPEKNQNAKTESTEKAAASESAKEDNLITVTSPIVGTFYRAAGPDKEMFVKVGDEVSVGSVLCIIEAMKLFNEIESEYNGRIVKILVEDASPVEYDQPLFLIEPL